MKKCSKCGEVKPVEAFSRKAASKDGLQPLCKECEAAYRDANRERLKEIHKAHRVANREERNKYNREYSAANREKLREYNERYRESNREKLREKSREKFKRLSESLGDLYIKQRLTHKTTLRYADIPCWLVEAKREQLRLTRELRK